MLGTGEGSNYDLLHWNIGLANHQCKYLTAETFGFKINASGSSMRNKQLWVLEQDEGEAGVVYIKSHLGRYIATDKQGNITCSDEEKGDQSKFGIVYHEDGRWAFQSKLNNCYFGATEDNVSCGEMTPSDVHYWNIRLALHPQLNMRNVNRKKYAHLDESNGRLQCTEIIPWGQDALITLEFISGKYAVKSCDNRYLCKDGSLIKEDTPSSNSIIRFTLEMHTGQTTGLAFKDNDGKYLTAVGKDAVMQTKNKTVSKDELFVLEDSHPQVFLTAHNGKHVSAKQGVDLTAKQEEVSDTETFQVEFDKKSNMWRLRSSSDKFWCVGTSGGVQCSGTDNSPDSLFGFEWFSNGQIALKSTNGKYITARMNGSLFASSDSVTDKEKYYMTLNNRPILVLRCEYGFVGFKNSSNPRIECNKANHECITMEHDNGKSGNYSFKGTNGKYWAVDSEGMINANSDEAKHFTLELNGQSRFAIKAPNGSFLKAEQNGIMCAKAIERGDATLFEY